MDKYTWVAEGSSYILADVLAAMLDAQLDKFDEIQARRARVGAAYRAGLADWAGARDVRMGPADDDLRRHSHHLFYLLFPTAVDRDAAMLSLRGDGVLAMFHYVPLHSSPRVRPWETAASSCR